MTTLIDTASDTDERRKGSLIKLAVAAVDDASAELRAFDHILGMFPAIPKADVWTYWRHFLAIVDCLTFSERYETMGAEAVQTFLSRADRSVYPPDMPADEIATFETIAADFRADHLADLLVARYRSEHES